MSKKKIFSLKLARALIDRGFYVVGVVPNTYKPWLNVFLFEDTKELRQALGELTQHK